MCRLQEAGNFVAYLNHIFLDIVRQHIVDLILGEVDGRFDMGDHARISWRIAWMPFEKCPVRWPAAIVSDAPSAPG